MTASEPVQSPCPECHPDRPDARVAYRCDLHAGRATASVFVLHEALDLAAEDSGYWSPSLSRDYRDGFRAALRCAIQAFMTTPAHVDERAQASDRAPHQCPTCKGWHDWPGNCLRCANSVTTPAHSAERAQATKNARGLS